MSMALRPIDNALPSAQERPKKQAKVSAPIRKQTELVANDENKAPAVENAEASVDYIASEYLKPVQEPDSKIQVSLSSFCLFVFFVQFVHFWVFSASHFVSISELDWRIGLKRLAQIVWIAQRHKAICTLSLWSSRSFAVSNWNSVLLVFFFSLFSFNQIDIFFIIIY